MAQVQALEMLLFLDEIEKARVERDELMRALVTTKEWSAEKMFPQYFSKKVDTEEEEQQAEAAGDAVSYDYSGVKWMSPDQAQDQYADLMAQLSKAGGQGTITAEDTTKTYTDWF